MSKSVNLRSRRGRKVRNTVSNPKLNRVLRRKPEVIVIEVRPLVGGHVFDVLPQNTLGTLVKENGTFGERLNSLSVCGLCGGLRSVDHKCAVLTHLPMACSQIGDDGNRANGTHVVKSEINLQGTKKVVQT
jgi:hypothetical protein